MNVFDIVDDFYTQDPDWNLVIERRHVDNYLRSLAWHGVEDDRLTEIWSNIMLFCVFLGNSENFLGDMNRENFIDCVGWCGRNVAGFTINVTHVQEFLGDIADFYSYLKKKKVIYKDDGPKAALAKLIVNDKLQLFDRKGNFLSEVEKFNLYSSPDLPAKVFLNVGEKLDNLFEAIRNYYADYKFHRDLERAAYMYSGIMESGIIDEKPDSEEYAQSFWDYFLFDYHLLMVDKRPIDYFYEDMCADNYTAAGEAYEDMLLELRKSRLILFSVKKQNEDNTFTCIDAFTNEVYTLSIPLDEEAPTENMLFLGHMYYNESMIINFIRGFKIAPYAKKRMLQLAAKAKAWFGLRKNGGISWQEFIERNGLFIRHICLIYSAFLRLDCFTHETAITEYYPQTMQEDKVTKLIADMMKPYAFSAYDIFLCQQMWSDFFAKTDKHVHMPEIWAAGIIRNFVDINGVYTYSLQKISEMCHSIPTNTISKTGKEIQEALALEKGDPRYINEEGLLLLLFS